MCGPNHGEESNVAVLDEAGDDAEQTPETEREMTALERNIAEGRELYVDRSPEADAHRQNLTEGLQSGNVVPALRAVVASGIDTQPFRQARAVLAVIAEKGWDDQKATAMVKILLAAASGMPTFIIAIALDRETRALFDGPGDFLDSTEAIVEGTKRFFPYGDGNN